jgi:hypothetical protein
MSWYRRACEHPRRNIEGERSENGDGKDESEAGEMTVALGYFLCNILMILLSVIQM